MGELSNPFLTQMQVIFFSHFNTAISILITKKPEAQRRKIIEIQHTSESLNQEPNTIAFNIQAPCASIQWKTQKCCSDIKCNQLLNVCFT